MIESIETKIFRKIKRAKNNLLFSVDMFAIFGNAKAVSKALERLTKEKKLYRVATGFYALPKTHDDFGVILPSIDEIALAIAKRDKARVVPTGSYALYKLGLTTQVPMNVVYYTDTSARFVKIGKRTIKFKKASSRNLSFKGEISMLAIQALRSLGKGSATDEEITHIKMILQNENPTHLKHDLLLAPVWIRELLTDKDLYRTIVAHRERFSHLGGVDYTKHEPQFINIIPPENLLSLWEKDYADMSESMIYGEKLSFSELIYNVKQINDKINKIGW